ncbi:hypothetical protein [Marixanthomonas spongiae]|uniref:Uncharacterized protein n=1 Tax=Marixanthomonas spongiae TaxID=2174845 RepID=A0A2U0I297_9FLAO|nr:hypothetical protein [Marixanthomonas spongiae]PVW15227.1 hypothetical protein DDV96_07420 [Marixanthomonas spongiae]
MVEAEFLRIAETENAKFSSEEKVVSLGGGVRSPYIIYLLTLYYKDHLIIIKNDTGTCFNGLIECKITTQKKRLNFELITKSHFSTLFSKNKKRFKIKSENININHFFKTSESVAHLNEIAKKGTFEPHITGVYKDGAFELTTEYSLQFSDWTQVLQPFINFYKEFIDTFK